MNNGEIIVSKVKNNKDGFESIYIGRNKNNNPLGNPFVMNSENERDDVCDTYQTYFDLEVKIENTPLRNEIIKLYRMVKSGKNINLQCFCAPKRCHGLTIKSFIENSV
jgi:hypothetical protein